MCPSDQRNEMPGDLTIEVSVEWRLLEPDEGVACYGCRETIFREFWCLFAKAGAGEWERMNIVLCQSCFEVIS